MPVGAAGSGCTTAPLRVVRTGPRITDRSTSSTGRLATPTRGPTPGTGPGTSRYPDGTGGRLEASACTPPHETEASRNLSVTAGPGLPQTSLPVQRRIGGRAFRPPGRATLSVGRGADLVACTSSPAATQAWLDGAFAAPTPAQLGAWDALARGESTLVVGPDRLGQDARRVPVGAGPARVRAGARGPEATLPGALRQPAEGTRRSTSNATCAARWPVSGRPRRGSVSPSRTSPSAMRSGDTPADERRLFARRPADILITTPESLFLLLTSAARESLRGVDTVIVDEVHAVCSTKRGAHLAVSLERLDALLEPPGPADRAVGDGPSGGRGRHLPHRRPAGHDRAAGVAEDHRAAGRRAGQGHCPRSASRPRI